MQAQLTLRYATYSKEKAAVRVASAFGLQTERLIYPFAQRASVTLCVAGAGFGLGWSGPRPTVFLGSSQFYPLGAVLGQQGAERYLKLFCLLEATPVNYLNCLDTHLDGYGPHLQASYTVRQGSQVQNGLSYASAPC